MKKRRGWPSNGLQELYRPKDEPVEVDIVAVHGLNGHATRTWTCQPENICWLNHPEFLPKYIKRARVLTWTYFAKLWSTMRSSYADEISAYGEQLLLQLQADRVVENAVRRPIIFICHSLGGLVVKEMMHLAASYTDRINIENRWVSTCTYGIVFFGTPHRGSMKANLLHKLQKAISAVVPRGLLRLELKLVGQLQHESESVQRIWDGFMPLISNFRICFFWEQKKTNLRYTKDYIVDEMNAAPVIEGTERYGIQADHREMCRFGNNTSQGFQNVMAVIKRYAKEAPEGIKPKIQEHVETIRQKWRKNALQLIESIDPTHGPSDKIRKLLKGR